MWNLGETTIKYLTEPSESGIADEDRKAVNAMMAPVRYAHPSPRGHRTYRVPPKRQYRLGVGNGSTLGSHKS
jgi:hypothetical protein